MPSPPFSVEVVTLASVATAETGGEDTVRGLALDEDGDLQVSKGSLVLVRGTEAILQSLKSRLRFFRGEWFLDLNLGVPYFERILVKNPNMAAVRDIFRDEILGTPGIADVEDLSLSFDASARRLTVSFRASTDTGELLTVRNLEVPVT